MSLSSATQTAIALALSEIENDPERKLSPKNRLAIYDSLGDEINLTHLTQTGASKFESFTDGYKRYTYLNVLAVMRVLPIWDADMPRSQQETPSNFAGIVQLPHYILQNAQATLQGNSSPAVLQKLEQELPMAIDALPMFFKYNVIEVAIAAYGFFLTANHHTPFNSKNNLRKTINLETVTDVDLYNSGSNWDVAWHASQAICAIDKDPIGAKERNAIEYDTQKRLEFWQWWLQEAVPQACEIDI